MEFVAKCGDKVTCTPKEWITPGLSMKKVYILNREVPGVLGIMPYNTALSYQHCHGLKPDLVQVQ